jgi:phage terminase large subunit-like protein
MICLDALTDDVLAVDDDDGLSELTSLVNDWGMYARPSQTRPAGCHKWLNVQAGRAFGKTRFGSEYTLDLCETWGDQLIGGIANKTPQDLRRVQIEGPSGLLVCARARGYEMEYQPSKARIRHPSGAVLDFYSGANLDQLRGFSGNFVWPDELPHYQYAEWAWRHFNYALRETAPWPGAHGIITSTPKRRSIVSSILLRPEYVGEITTVRGSTLENVANLDPSTWRTMQIENPEGSWLRRQELSGDLVDEGEGGFTQAIIDVNRIIAAPNNLSEILISIDPATTGNQDSDATGIVIIGRGGHYDLSHFYVLADDTVEMTHVEVWSKAVLRRCVYMRHLHNCPVRILIETNQGGDTWRLIFEQTAASEGIPMPDITGVHASRSKTDRAAAAAVLYTQNRAHHVGHPFVELERECVQWVPGMSSPDRLDALAHGLLELADPDQTGSLFDH